MLIKIESVGPDCFDFENFFKYSTTNLYFYSPVAGGIIGLGLGGIGAVCIQWLAHWPILVSGWSIGVSLLVSAATGIFFGIYPACKAAMMDPVEALRY